MSVPLMNPYVPLMVYLQVTISYFTRTYCYSSIFHCVVGVPFSQFHFQRVNILCSSGCLNVLVSSISCPVRCLILLVLTSPDYILYFPVGVLQSQFQTESQDYFLYFLQRLHRRQNKYKKKTQLYVVKQTFNEDQVKR